VFWGIREGALGDRRREEEGENVEFRTMSFVNGEDEEILRSGVPVLKEESVGRGQGKIKIEIKPREVLGWRRPRNITPCWVQ